jgi:NADPH-dependent 2,4-dienoyl-CoA reductase/sulfur reductase-like enzyme
VTDRVDIVVVGAGPAGIAAAVTAAEGGARVAIVDESPRLGGQIWHGSIPDRARPWFDRLRAASVITHGSTEIFDAGSGWVATTAGEIGCSQMILACGARELLLPFPGWTLPGVTGAGGLQALVHDGLDVAHERVVIGGTGPLLLQVSAELRAHGADIRRVAEQTSLLRLLRFGLGLSRDKRAQAMSLATTKLRASSWVESVHGDTRVEEAVVRTPFGRERIACERVAVGYSLVPNTELARLLGCACSDDGVVVDDHQRTTVDGVLAAGEICGIKGAGGAIHDGICAGLVATGRPPTSLTARDAEREFGRRLERSFSLRPEVLRLAQDDTLLCRCEDVPLREARAHDDWTSAKLHTRCGMGSCQGRVCGSATRKLFGWGPTGSRPPLVPIPIGQLMNERIEP